MQWFVLLLASISETISICSEVALFKFKCVARAVFARALFGR